MQSKVPLAVLVLLTATVIPVRATNLDDHIPDQQSIDALEAKALTAQPKEQCFLYAQIVHEMTELSLRHAAAGEGEKANALLKNIQEFTHKIHMSVSDDNKRLKNAEILLRHTAFRLNELLHNSSSDDRDLVAQTLTQVNKAESEAMLQVFRK